MKLLELQVEGYRSLKSVTWKPGNLNVLIGPNGSGKTHLINALELLATSAQGNLGNYVQKDGGFQAMVWDGQAKSIQFRLRTSGLTGFSKFLGSSLEVPIPPQDFDYELSLGGYYGWEGPLPFSVVESESLRFSLPESADAPPGTETWLERVRMAGRAVMMDSLSQTFKDVQQQAAAGESLLSLARPPFSLNPEISNFQQGLASWSIYQDVWSRVYPGSPQESAKTSIRMPSVPSYETRVSPDADNLVNVLYTLYSKETEGIEQQINDAMNAAFLNAFERLEFRPVADLLIQMRIRWKGLKRGVPAANLSDGTLRFLFLIAVLANPNPPPLIVIEEPEIGLHPRMMSIIAEYAVDAAERTQVIFTTHSPDFLSAFRDTVPTTTVCNWENGETILRVLSGPDLDYWLREYSLGELFRSGHLESME